MPCGITGHGVTSLIDLGLPVTMADVDVALRACFEEVFGLKTDLSPGRVYSSTPAQHSSVKNAIT